jgi:hypothetical protein
MLCLNGQNVDNLINNSIKIIVSAKIMNIMFLLLINKEKKPSLQLPVLIFMLFVLSQSFTMQPESVNAFKKKPIGFNNEEVDSCKIFFSLPTQDKYIFVAD